MYKTTDTPGTRKSERGSDVSRATTKAAELSEVLQQRGEPAPKNTPVLILRVAAGVSVVSVVMLRTSLRLEIQRDTFPGP